LLPSALGIGEFVNADEIARGLSPFKPETSALAAGRIMLRRMRELASSGKSFAIETTCAGLGHVHLLRRCKAMGYRVVLIFLWLPSVQTAIARVAQRVGSGGHYVADAIVIRRYTAGLRNLRRLYLPLADMGFIYDNSTSASPLIAEQGLGGSFIVHDRAKWTKIEAVAR
jgi:predicted ABC-type ATPase